MSETSGMHLYPLSDPNSIACQLKTPVWLLGVGQTLVRQYFATEDRVSIEKSTFRWDVDQTKSKIFIDMAENFNVKVVGKRPAVIVSLTEQNFSEKGINNNNIGMDPQGNFNYISIQSAGWIFSCYGYSPVESMCIASELKYFFTTYRPIIRSEYGLDGFGLRSISKTAKSTEFNEYYLTQMFVGFQVQESWTTSMEALRVKQIALFPEVIR